MAKTKTHKFGSKEWYKEEIRQMTKEVNFRFWEARNSGKMTPQLKAAEKRLILYGGEPSVAAKNRGETIGLGFHKKPSKGMLQRQWGELRRVLRKDIWSPQGEKAEKDREEEAYKSFKEFHPNWSKEKWINFVQLLGNVPTEILQSFSYERSSSHRSSKTAHVYNTKNEGFVEAFSFAYENDVDLFRVMEKVYSEIKNLGFNQEKALDALKDAIKIEIAKNKGEPFKEYSEEET